MQQGVTGCLRLILNVMKTCEILFRICVNVRLSFSFCVIMRKYLLVIVYLVALELFSSVCSICNPFSCLTFVNSLFSYNYDQDGVCEKFQRVKQCVDSCLPLFTKNVRDVESGIDLVFKKVCKDETLNNAPSDFWHKKCVERRKFQLLSCVYEALSLIPDEPLNFNNKNVFHCRQMMEAEKCPSDVLTCKEEVMSYTEHLLLKYFQPLQEELCFGSSLSEIWAVNVHSGLEDVEEFRKVFKCIDLHFKQVWACVPSKWTTNYVVNQHQINELCSAFNVSLACVSGVIRKECGEDVLNSSLSRIQKFRLALSSQCPKPEISTTTENIASQMVLTPYNNDENVIAVRERQNGEMNDSSYQDDSHSKFIVIHFGMFETSKAHYVRCFPVIMYVFCVLFISVLMAVQ